MTGHVSGHYRTGSDSITLWHVQNVQFETGHPGHEPDTNRTLTGHEPDTNRTLLFSETVHMQHMGSNHSCPLDKVKDMYDLQMPCDPLPT